MREDLHQQLDQLNIGRWHCRTIVHAMIDAGLVIELSCQHPKCAYQGEPFDDSSVDRKNMVRILSIDHIEPRRRGGSDRLENLRIVHHGCNARWWHDFTDEERADRHTRLLGRPGRKCPPACTCGRHRRSDEAHRV